MIIFINGSCNSGKSTITKILADKLSNTAKLEIDHVRAMIDWMPLEQSIPINLQNAISLIKNFSNGGLNVVVPYPLSQKNYDHIMSELEDLDTEIHHFTLAPRLEKILTNRSGQRELDDWERNRIKYHYEIGLHKPSFGEIIDNSDLTPEETADYIIAKIK